MVIELQTILTTEKNSHALRRYFSLSFSCSLSFLTAKHHVVEIGARKATANCSLSKRSVLAVSNNFPKVEKCFPLSLCKVSLCRRLRDVCVKEIENRFCPRFFQLIYQSGGQLNVPLYEKVIETFVRNFHSS
jgi:hypothetical protein